MFCQLLPAVSVINGAVVISIIPQKISLQKLDIQGNNFQCSCDNTWMIKWILNYTEVIENYKEVKCQMKGGKWIPIVQMKEEDMGCLPNGSFAVWKIVGQLFKEHKKHSKFYIHNINYLPPY